MLYFAYGSKMSSVRLLERTPSARTISQAYLIGYTMRVHKRGRDGTAKCDAVATGCADDLLYGVLYSLNDEEMLILDRIEGAGVDYANKPVEVVAPDGPVRARCYFAYSRNVDDSLLPTAAYMYHVITGAIEHGLPDQYVRCLKAVRTARKPVAD